MKQPEKLFLQMNKYGFLHLLWIFPLYLAFIVFQQLSVFTGTSKTYSEGETYNAEVIDFDIKQIAAQSNGYVILKFTPSGENEIERRLSLSVQMAQQILNSAVVPIRYLENGYPEIVMIPTYDLQKSISLSNTAFAGLGLLVTFIVTIFISKFANKRLKEGAEVIIIERVD